MLKPSLNRYNTQVHSSTKMSPSKAHDLNNALREIMLKATTLQEKNKKSMD